MSGKHIIYHSFFSFSLSSDDNDDGKMKSYLSCLLVIFIGVSRRALIYYHACWFANRRADEEDKLLQCLLMLLEGNVCRYQYSVYFIAFVQEALHVQKFVQSSQVSKENGDMVLSEKKESVRQSMKICSFSNPFDRPLSFFSPQQNIPSHWVFSERMRQMQRMVIIITLAKNI